MKRYLLDTHILIWALTQPRRLSTRARQVLEYEDVHVSVLSLWEMLVKQERRRLPLPDGSLVNVVEKAGARWLALHPAHAEAGLSLGALHGDPIDRMLVGTARVERMVLMTRDEQILERAAPILGELLMEA
ncbi:MAG: type II toxin-antitoxin system VapC family toxin [Methylibium sp.]|uniref:type II toxin-antitoxin system VapC family toxin n=1 Tax=Methylibium sp. TaxID=2067992 RepID=UPI0017D7F884|nr:type II toxin-antitoxin system VapC family toxin [Methylibium sp.]MBA3597534.1 type II toxin-antitoxin system VapC family toxin [Methylibium sp.]